MEMRFLCSSRPISVSSRILNMFNTGSQLTFTESALKSELELADSVLELALLITDSFPDITQMPYRYGP